MKTFYVAMFTFLVVGCRFHQQKSESKSNAAVFDYQIGQAVDATTGMPANNCLAELEISGYNVTPGDTPTVIMPRAHLLRGQQELANFLLEDSATRLNIVDIVASAGGYNPRPGGEIDLLSKLPISEHTPVAAISFSESRKLRAVKTARLAYQYLNLLNDGRYEEFLRQCGSGLVAAEEEGTYFLAFTVLDIWHQATTTVAASSSQAFKNLEMVTNSAGDAESLFKNFDRYIGMADAAKRQSVIIYFTKGKRPTTVAGPLSGAEILEHWKKFMVERDAVWQEPRLEVKTTTIVAEPNVSRSVIAQKIQSIRGMIRQASGEEPIIKLPENFSEKVYHRSFASYDSMGLMPMFDNLRPLISKRKTFLNIAAKTLMSATGVERAFAFAQSNPYQFPALATPEAHALMAKNVADTAALKEKINTAYTLCMQSYKDKDCDESILQPMIAAIAEIQKPKQTDPIELGEWDICPVAEYNVKAAPPCAPATYQSCRHESFGPEMFALRRDALCGAERYIAHHDCDRCGPGSRIERLKGCNKCEHPDFGIDVAKECRDPSFGIEGYNVGTGPVCGTASYQTCADASFGVARRQVCARAKF